MTERRGGEAWSMEKGRGIRGKGAAEDEGDEQVDGTEEKEEEEKEVYKV